MISGNNDLTNTQKGLLREIFRASDAQETRADLAKEIGATFMHLGAVRRAGLSDVAARMGVRTAMNALGVHNRQIHAANKRVTTRIINYVQSDAVEPESDLQQ